MFIFFLPSFQPVDLFFSLKDLIKRFEVEKIDYIYDQELSEEVVTHLIDKKGEKLFFDDMHFSPLLSEKVANSIRKVLINVQGD